MEILTINLISCHHTRNFTSNPFKSKLPRPQISTPRFDLSKGSLKFSRFNRFSKGFKAADSKVLSGNYEGYVIEPDIDVETIKKRDRSSSKILIPGLPDKSTGDFDATVDSHFWEWKPKFRVHYETSGSQNVKKPAVLFLPGFGVGSFHYQNQLIDLGRDFRVWAIDFLGQGLSLPLENPTQLMIEDDEDSIENHNLWGFGDQAQPWADELVYSVDLWRDQVRHFIEQVICEPVYIVGNSLGGFVALYSAATNPHLVKGITLLNATPFWGFLPNRARSPTLAKLFPWSGTFPLPSTVKKLTELLWQKISDPQTIADILGQVYADHSTDVDDLFARIVDVTKHPAAAASFASIMCAPQGQLSFRECLRQCKLNNVPISLMYGKEDPWVKPVWGVQAKMQVPEAPYYLISPAGHCPHDEVPEVVNFLIRGWIRSVESCGSEPLPLLDEYENLPSYSIYRDVEFTRGRSKKSVNVQFFGSEIPIWNQILSYLTSPNLKLEARS